MSWIVALLTWLTLFGVMSYLFFLSQIIIHACSHFALTGNPSWDRWIGSLLSIFNFHSFDGWRTLHMLHHQYTNEQGKDPAAPREGQRLPAYLFTALLGMARFTSTPFYHRHTRRGKRLLHICGSSGRLRRTGLLIAHSWEMYVGVVLFFGAALVCWAWLGPLKMFSLFGVWLAPWIVGQLLMADFNFRTHDGCPTRTSQRPYSGQDTQSFYDGVWHVINIVTLGFYRHREHHVDPKLCLWFGNFPHLPHKKAADKSLGDNRTKERE